MEMAREEKTAFLLYDGIMMVTNWKEGLSVLPAE